MERRAAGQALYLGVGGGLQEAEAVPKALTGQAQFDLLLHYCCSALQNHLVFLEEDRDQGRQGRLKDNLLGPWGQVV